MNLLSKLNKGDLVRFEGKLKKYGSLINSDIFYVTEGVLLEKIRSKETTKDVKGTSLSQEELIAICIASGIPPTACRDAISEN